MASNKLSLLVRHGCLSRVLQKSSNPLIKPNHQTGIRWYPSGGRAITVAGKPRHDYPMAIEINKRLENVATDQKLRSGKEVHPRRSDFVEWNYNTELIAFQARLGEKFDDNTLRQAFISLEYVAAQQKKLLELQNINSLESIEDEEDVVEEEDKEDLETTSSKSTIVSNEKLAEVGKRVILDSLRAYLRTSLPHLPEEGVEAITNFLTREELLAHVSFHIGTLDLVLSQEYPPSVQTMSQVFEALIGALASEDEFRASKLVLDLVATQLHGQDLTDLWDLPDPMGTLEAILTKENRGLPEARLLWSSGKETILACYHVGVYSDRELIGQAPGESAMIAEEMAARDALRKLFKFDDASKPLPFGKELHKMKLKSTPNPTLEEWSSSNISIV